ncbi:hypothetical protein H4217_000279 [Coemansia sp. RSA 1939]|nr:hypothetical protein H4217_000279 [Coemansia sp. RSA 1939]KAJ2617857.1 hypothetical protein EV177_000343 [Coemansia sp. RSA 1804]KAJ2695507.1 hypothetical protein GGH99_000077 [Coemansia sp. RSA 1285]
MSSTAPITPELVVAQYESGKLNLDGTLGHLTPEQEALLKKLWRKLLRSFEKSTQEISQTEQPEDTARTTLKRSTRVRAVNNNNSSTDRMSTPQPEPAGAGSSSSSSSIKGGIGGWFGFGTSKSSADLQKKKQQEKQQDLQLVAQVAPHSSAPPPFIQTAAHHAQRSIRDAFWGAVLCDHPDVLLLRFLRARKWNVDAALEMLLTCLRWRLDEEIDWVVWVGESELNWRLLRRGIGVIHKTDRLGQPVLYIPVRLNDPQAQPADHMLDYTVHLMEVSRLFLHPPVEKVCLVFDTTDMALANMDWTFFKTFLHYLEHYYPECLGLVLIYNASWIFYSLWKLIRPLLDPVVASKVQFAGSPQELHKFIAPENLPTEYGGTDPFRFEYVLPEPDENGAMFRAEERNAALRARESACDAFEAATRDWDARARQDAADALVAASRESDKYVRARTLYHRIGVVDDMCDVKWGESG